jgi:preprotein translocase subunit SecG
MNIEKSNMKVFNIIIIVVLAAVLVTVFGGFLMQQYAMPMRGDGLDRSFAPMQSESAQTGPTGALVLSVGIFLLSVGFFVLVMVLWLGRRKTDALPPELKT